MKSKSASLCATTASFALAVLFMSATTGESMAAKGYHLKKSSFKAMKGWRKDDHAEAYLAFRRSCEHETMALGRIRSGTLKAICRDVRTGPARLSRLDARRFFEHRFQPYLVIARRTSKGLFTGYFEPEYAGDVKKSGKYKVPVLPVPDNLVEVNGKNRPKGFPRGLRAALETGSGLKPVPTRGEIEAGALDKSVTPIAWLADPVDAFFLHIQGSGRVKLPDGGSLRLAFAGKNGHPYSSIGKKLKKSGILKSHQLSMQSVQKWLRENPVKARKVLHSNKSYIFFRPIELDPALGPIGGQGVPLTAGRSLAIDRRYHRYGQPLWLDTRLPDKTGSRYIRYRRLMIAQDTGSAIKGPIRGDIFFGTGDAAGFTAGRVKEAGRLHVLLPKPRHGVKKSRRNANKSRRKK